MKKILFLLVLGVTTLCASAQTRFVHGESKPVLASNGLARDTVSNTGVETWVFTVPSDASTTISVIATFTKITGTLAGSAIIQGSADGVNWADAVSAYTVTDVATQSKAFTFDLAHYKFYQLRWTGTGTMSGSAIVQATVKKRTL